MGRALDARFRSGFDMTVGAPVRWAAAVVCGAVLAILGEYVTPGALLTISIALAAILGLWTGRAERNQAFWHGASLAFVSILIFAASTCYFVYSRPVGWVVDVLPPWPITAAILTTLAVGAGVVGGTVAWVVARLNR